MMFRIFLLLCAISVFACEGTEILELEDKDGAFETEFVAATPAPEPPKSFGQKIRDWFRRTKERIFGKSSSINVQLPSDTQTSDADKAKIKEQLVQVGGFFLDLDNVRFNSMEDWGFRIGKWYFIRKSSEDKSSDYKTGKASQGFQQWGNPNKSINDIEPKNSEKSTVASISPSEENGSMNVSFGEVRDVKNHDRSAEVVEP